MNHQPSSPPLISTAQDFNFEHSSTEMRVLISVRSVEEALQATAAGAHFIDLKEPGQGALGGLPLPVIRDIVKALHAQPLQRPVTFKISATIGDLPMHALGTIQARVHAVAACGVDYVKVGITREPEAAAVLDWLGRCGLAIVPVLIADQGLDDALLAQALAWPFAGLMLDTANKKAGSLFDVMTVDAVQHFIHTTRQAGLMVGVAGALRIAQLPLLARLAPDFAGFRSAVCVGDRSAALDAERLRLLLATLADHASSVRTSPINSDRIQANSVL
jgi:(5-formylfuran-3-yl)methyl phosphate synthase